jgi:hypothetical protein
LPLCSSQRKCIFPQKIQLQYPIARTPRKNHKLPYCKLTPHSEIPPSIQLVFSNFYLGTALGALCTTVSYTTTNTGAWPFGGENKSTAVDEFPRVSRYGSWTAHLGGANALADRAGRNIATVYGRHGPARARGEAAELVGSVKIVATDRALRVTAGVVEVTGVRAKK